MTVLWHGLSSKEVGGGARELARESGVAWRGLGAAEWRGVPECKRRGKRRYRQCPPLHQRTTYNVTKIRPHAASKGRGEGRLHETLCDEQPSVPVQEEAFHLAAPLFAVLSTRSEAAPALLPPSYPKRQFRSELLIFPARVFIHRKSERHPSPGNGPPRPTPPH